MFGKKKKEAVRIRILVGPIEEQDMPLVMTATQQCLLTMQPLDAQGNPAKVDNVAQWQTANPDVVRLVEAPDGVTCMCMSVAVGDTQVSCTADADLGEGTRNITGLLDVSVRAAEAVTMGIVAGTPEEQPVEPGATKTTAKSRK